MRFFCSWQRVILGVLSNLGLLEKDHDNQSPLARLPQELPSHCPQRHLSSGVYRRRLSSFFDSTTINQPLSGVFSETNVSKALFFTIRGVNIFMFFVFFLAILSDLGLLDLQVEFSHRKRWGGSVFYSLGFLPRR